MIHRLRLIERSMVAAMLTALVLFAGCSKQKEEQAPGGSQETSTSAASQNAPQNPAQGTPPGASQTAPEGPPQSAAPGAAQTAASGSSQRRPAPEFTLKDLDGKDVSLSQFRGKVVILDFWATWCPPCRMEIPHFVELERDYRSKGLAVVGISLDQGGAQVVRPFAEQNGINYTMLVNGQPLAGLYGGITGIPTTFVLDKQGRVAKAFEGYRDKSEFEKLVQDLLAEG